MNLVSDLLNLLISPSIEEVSNITPAALPKAAEAGDVLSRPRILPLATQNKLLSPKSKNS